AIKSILYNKFSYATREGVELEIEINDDVTIQYTRLLDVVRILSILLDNAIEAALESKELRLLVEYIKETDMERVISETSTKVEIEINDDVTNQYTRLLDVVRILSILLDNAIEAALESKELRLLVEYIKETDIERVIIENSTKVEIAPLFKENYTTKSGNRGQGLATVKRLIGHYPNVSLKTSSSDYTFTQELVLNKEEKDENIYFRG